MAYDAHVTFSFRTFVVGVSVISISLINYIFPFMDDHIRKYFYIWLVGYVLFVYFLIFKLETGYNLQVGLRSLSLGLLFGLGLLLSRCATPSWIVFGWYFCILSFFHISEYVTTAMINPQALSLDSFLINHSKEYSFAAVASWVEFVTERYFFPQTKMFYFVSLVGLLICITGEFIRKLAMFTAHKNFNHLIQVHREEGHTLVTHGIYGMWRHPSYVGWFWWSIGTQIILINPICLVGYTLASWNFFNERIIEEEITLLNFFGEEYYKYQKRVPTGLPFIKGFEVNFS